MATTNKQTPALRFPSFTEEWEEKTLGEVCEIKRGKTFSKSDIDEDGTELCIHYGELLTKYKESITEVYSRTFRTNGLRSKKGDVLMPSSAETPDALSKASALLLNNVILGSDMNILRTNDNTNAVFLSYVINNSEKIITRLVTGGTVFHLYAKQLNDLAFLLPSLPEQQKIAACLSSLDALTTAAQERLDALKAHKKGLLQRLFPREGRKTPELRFAGFKGAWEEKRLGEVANVVRGGSPRPIDEYLTSDKDGLNWLKIGDISSEAKYITSTSEKVKQSALKKTRVVSEGELILSNSMSFGRPYILKISTCIHDGWIAIKDIKNETFEEFLHYFISSEEIQKYFKSKVAGGVVKNLKASTIQDLPILFPSLPEQQKIASCLSSLDTLIEVQQERIALLKTHKKGLLQQLFPNY